MATSIFKRIDDALETLSPAVAYAMAPYLGTLPDTFITYQLIDGVPEQSADNVEKLRGYRVQVNICSKSGLDTLPDVNTAMTAAGFKKGPERPLPKAQDTGHFILAKDYFYLEDV
jgi:hypothetical protein